MLRHVFSIIYKPKWRPQMASETPVEAEVKSDGRFKLVTNPVTGEQVKRIDYIRELWKAGTHTRSAIAKHLTEISGETVPYQIVFAATKGIPGGPVAEAKPADALAEAQTENPFE
jgi:hypothetical protein